MGSRGRVLITGAAGFIGSHLTERMLSDGWLVTAVDNFDPFYDPALKRANIRGCLDDPHLSFRVLDIRSPERLAEGLPGSFDLIVHLAAKAGVRPSIADPGAYSAVNINGTQNLLEFARARAIPHFVFASSSSVYGINPSVPWTEEDHVLLPISPYAGTKVAGELLGHVYSHLYGIRFVALRFFTVYGPRQRPDLAIHHFARLLLEGQILPLFGDGLTRRDYTYVDDIVEGIIRTVSYDSTAYEIINLGNDRTVSLIELVQLLEEATGIPARVEHLAEQPGDVPVTWANISKARRLLSYEPGVPIEDGIRRFVRWLKARS